MKNQQRPAEQSAQDGDVLAERIDRALRQVPARRAPASLASRVLAELARQAALPWYRRPWTDWPEIWRWISTVALSGGVAGFWRLSEMGWAAAKTTAAFSAVEMVPTYWHSGEATTQALVLGLQTLPASWYLYGAVVLSVALAGTLGLGSAAWRLLRHNQI